MGMRRSTTINVTIDIYNLHNGGTTTVKFDLAPGQHYHVDGAGVHIHNNHDGPDYHFHVSSTYSLDSRLDTRYGYNGGSSVYPDRRADGRGTE